MTKLRKHAFLTSRGLEYRECGEWKIEEADFMVAVPSPDSIYSRLWSENRAIWILDEIHAQKLSGFPDAPVARFDVTRNTQREVSEDEDVVIIAGDGSADRAMSERISFRPKGVSEQTKDCCLLFPDKAENWGFSADDNPEVVERALDSLQAEFGRSLVYPPGRLAIYLMEGARDRANEQVEYKRKPRFGKLQYSEPERDENPFVRLGKDLDWRALRPPLKRSRAGVEAEVGKRYVHAFDKNAAFLQCVGVELPIGDYRYIDRAHLETPDYYKWCPGLWKVKSLPYFCSRPVGAAGAFRARSDIAQSFNPPGLRGTLPFSQWVTTPTLRLLCELDLIADIEAAYLPDDSHRLFPTYYSRIKQAIDSCDRPFADSIDEQALRLMKTFIKQIYVKGIGYLRSAFFTEEWFYRPDWWATIVTEAAARMMRDAIEVHRECDVWPIAAYIDCLYYVSDHHDPWESFPIFNGRFSNKFKHKGTAPFTPEMASAAYRGLKPGEFGGLFKRAAKAYEQGEI